MSSTGATILSLSLKVMNKLFLFVCFGVSWCLIHEYPLLLVLLQSPAGDSGHVSHGSTVAAVQAMQQEGHDS